MSSVINAPEVLVDFKGSVRVEFKYDDVIVGSTQAADTPINIIECPVEPLVTLQCLNSNLKPEGPVWVYVDGEWGTYHPDVHKIPSSDESDSLVDAGTDVSDVFVTSHSPSVEILRSENAPTSDVDPEVEEDWDEDDELSEMDEED